MSGLNRQALARSHIPALGALLMKSPQRPDFPNPLGNSDRIGALAALITPRGAISREMGTVLHMNRSTWAYLEIERSRQC
jgi:hypothetical protein